MPMSKGGRWREVINHRFLTRLKKQQDKTEIISANVPRVDTLKIITIMNLLQTFACFSDETNCKIYQIPNELANEFLEIEKVKTEKHK